MLPKVLVGLPIDRRAVLIGAVATTTGFAVGFRPARSAADSGAASPFQGYVTIDRDGRVTVMSAHMDMGQACHNGIATLVAEELDADWTTIDAIGAAGNPALYGNVTWGGAIQGTGGSSAMASSFERYRRAGATARAMLVAAAAETWNVPEADVTVSGGVLSHGSGRRATFGDLADAAARQPVPADVRLKSPADWTLIGNEAARRYDTRPKTDGTQVFTVDVRLPGLLTAVMIHPPMFGARLAGFDAEPARAVKGFVEAVATPRGVAVIAEGMWAALKARDLVSATWDTEAAETRGSSELMAAYRAQAEAPGLAIARAEGDADGALAGATTTLEATYEFPFLAHAALEPLNAVARMNDDGTLEVWGGHQLPDLYQAVAAEIAGVAPHKVRLHVMKTGGGFGRRAVADADVIVEAVAAAKALGWRAPVKVQWTRADDMKGGRYRPLYVHRVRGGIDSEGRLVAWSNHIVGQSILRGTPFEAGLVQNGIDLTSVEGASSIPYAIPNMKVELSTMDAGVPVLWWRAVGSTHTAYVVETFIDELAEAAGRDAVEFRLALLDGHPRHAAVLRLAADRAGWGTPAPAGHHRGVALAESFGTIVAQVAEISVRDDGGIKVERVVCALDCGVAINPDVIRAQMEGGIGYGLGAVLKSELTVTAGAADQDNFDGYDVLRLDEMPTVEVHIVPSEASPTGVGEPGLPPIGPAVANAVYAATGKRVRALPMLRALRAT